MTDQQPVEILPFAAPADPAHAKAFRDLNLEWLEALFYVEDYDKQQLQHPEHILEQGGEIWFARVGDAYVGTGALYCLGDGEYEVAKMAVTPRVRGRGVGRLLLERLIARFQALGGRRLVLATNAKLETAIALYRKSGFVDYTPAKPSGYARANVFMEWRGGAQGPS